MFQNVYDKFSKAPSIVWVLLFPLAIILLIGTIMGGFLLIATVEGVASIIFLLIGWFGFKFAASFDKEINGLVIGIAVTFYALMGMAIDQTGNAFFNYPFNFFCPSGSHMSRSIETLHPLPGRTDIIQNYTCFDSSGQETKQIGMIEMIGLRFVEYVIIAYVFIGIHKLLKHSNNIPAPTH